MRPEGSKIEYCLFSRSLGASDLRMERDYYVIFFVTSRNAAFMSS